MASKIFVNFPVKDLKKSIEFFTKLGYRFNQQFTDETGTCMIVTDNIFVMLLTEEKFKSFTPKQICDAKKYTEALVALSLDSRTEVDAMVRKAVAAGGFHIQPASRSWLHVCSRIPGFGWAHLGAFLYGSELRKTVLRPRNDAENYEFNTVRVNVNRPVTMSFLPVL